MCSECPGGVHSDDLFGRKGGHINKECASGSASDAWMDEIVTIGNARVNWCGAFELDLATTHALRFGQFLLFLKGNERE